MYYEKQCKFLVMLGALLNSKGVSIDDNPGIYNDMISYYENNKLINNGSFSKYIQLAIKQLDSVIEVAVDGTIFVKEDCEELFNDIFERTIQEVADYLELNVDFDGIDYDEIKKIVSNKELFEDKVLKGELQYSYVKSQEDESICSLTEKQIQELLLLTIKRDIYRYEI